MADDLKPQYVASLEKAYGPPTDAGFGSGVFFETQAVGADLGQLALKAYRRFVGKLWDKYGESAWKGTWKDVYSRPAGAKRDIVAELRAIADPAAASSVPMVLDVVEGADAARAALAAAYDDAAVSELRVFTIGDGAAMSGLLIAGRRAQAGEATFVVFLLD